MSRNTINFSNEGTNINRKTHEVLDQQQIKQYNQGLTEISEELNEDKSKNQQKVDDLKQKLNTLSAKEQLLEKFENGKAVFFALQKEGGEKAIQNRINEFNSYDNYNNNGKEGIQHVAYSVRTKFNDVLSKSDEEVAEIYLKYFDSQTSYYFLGNFLVDAEEKAFREGFYAAKNWKIKEWPSTEEELSDDSLLNAQIIDKLTAIQKYINSNEYHELLKK